MEDKKYNPYKENGFANRKEYLQDLAEQYNVPLGIVYQAAQLLGKNEDFDGLLTTLEDSEDLFDGG